MKKSHLIYILLFLSLVFNLYFLLTSNRNLLYAGESKKDCLIQLNERTYAENSSTEPVLGSPVQYFILHDAKRQKILYVFKYKDNITSEIADEKP